MKEKTFELTRTAITTFYI